jgi:UDPglucose 6-dehydrogenase
MKDISIIGAGYVGLVTGACLAKLGNKVIVVDKESDKIEKLKKGMVPIYEPGLEEMIAENRRLGRLSFSTSIQEATKATEVIFICVGTPAKPSGEPELSAVEAVSEEIAKAMDGYRLVVEKSTVPARTGEWVKRTIMLNNKEGADFDVASNPEFLREGSAINDFMQPDRIVIGVDSERARNILVELYAPLQAPIIITDINSAELIKHASNSFLALKISYINAVANICELVGADVVKVARGMGLDKRIGKDFLEAGVGYGGSCFPKDLAAFIKMAEDAGYNFELLHVVQQINSSQRALLIRKIKELIWNLKGKRIGILGLSFKPNTDDMREAPSIEIIQKLKEEGAKVAAYDPEAMERAKEILPDIEYCKDAYEVAEKSEVLVLLTEWDEFKNLDMRKIKDLLLKPNLVDGRNLYEPTEMKELGFNYRGIGRK